MMLLAAACSILLPVLAEPARMYRALAPHQPVIRKRMPPRVLAPVRVRRSGSWLSYRRFQTIRCIPGIL